ncbi:carbamoyltransferase HypF, partial [bacterium]|nr:carbamoyltransferase HypF [bacterium]
SNNFCYSYNIYEEKNMQILNLLPTVYDIINDSQSIENKAFGFHFTIAAAITEMAEIGRNKFNINTVGLSGGVFQNLLLLDLTVKLLEEKGFEILIHKRIPANDSGISLGQAILAAQAIKKGD